MIVLDTNVISELMHPEPHPGVLSWIAAQAPATLYTAVINQAEILYGIALLSRGRRRTAFAVAAKTMFAEAMAGRILPFDGAATVYFAEAVAFRRRAGNPIGVLDALIAAIALAAGAWVATRDLGGFDGCNLTLINPWDAP